MSKNRSAYFDTVKGMLIVLVVFAHFLYGFAEERPDSLIGLGVKFIYMFHMPAFVFVSGYFSRSGHSRGREQQLRLLKTFFLLDGVYIVFGYLTKGSAHLLMPYYSSWYLLSLVIWRAVIVPAGGVRYCGAAALAAAFLAGFGKDIDNTMALARTVAFFPFFYAGYSFGTREPGRLNGTKCPGKAAFAVLLFAAAAAAGLLVLRLLPVDFHDLLMHSYSAPADIAVRAGCFAVAVLMTACLLCLPGEKEVPLLTKAGRNSMAIYLLHRPVSQIAESLIRRLGPAWQRSVFLIPYAAAATLLLVLVLGSDRAAHALNVFLHEESAETRFERILKTAGRIVFILLPAAIILLSIMYL